MDRDKRYERTKIAYDGIVSGIGQTTSVDHVIEVCVGVVWMCHRLALSGDEGAIQWGW